MIINPKKISYFFLLVLCFSCTEPIDVDQLDDASLDTSYMFTLVHLNLKAPKFLDEFNDEIPITSDMVSIPEVGDLNPYLKRAEFIVKTENSFNRNFTLSILFYDEDQKLIYTLKPVIIVPSNSDVLTFDLEIPENDINVIYNTRFFGMNMSLWKSTTGETIKVTDDSVFILKSAITLYFNFKKV
ncbi:MAG: hypothetical protein COB81_02510 [Flavobacteriaceae bacterium]|nr:MAG: hypothetical protein COB81_02510 [Flavobacteriaceae bacterium]